MSERKIFRPSTVAITSPPTCDLQPIRDDSTRATASAAAAWAKRDFLFKYFSRANSCSRATPARREDMHGQTTPTRSTSAITWKLVRKPPARGPERVAQRPSKHDREPRGSRRLELRHQSFRR